jgi:hypothetical protein
MSPSAEKSCSIYHFDDGLKSLGNIQKSARWLIATTDAIWSSANIRTGNYRPLNLDRAPYNLPKPVHMIPDEAALLGQCSGLGNRDDLYNVIGRDNMLEFGILAVVAVLATAPFEPTSASSTPPQAAGIMLVVSEEFDGSSLDTKKWLAGPKPEGDSGQWERISSNRTTRDLPTCTMSRMACYAVAPFTMRPSESRTAEQKVVLGRNQLRTSWRSPDRRREEGLLPGAHKDSL